MTETTIMMIPVTCLLILMAMVYIACKKAERGKSWLEEVTFQQDKIIEAYAQDYHKTETLLQKNEDQLNKANMEIRRLRDELGEL